MIGTKVLEEQNSKFNGKVRVVKTWGMGTYIQAEGLTQSGGIVESIWKQTINKIKNLKFKINNCLILGLGGGTVAKIIRKNWPEAKITGVEIDPVMVKLGSKYLGLDDAKVDIKIMDAGNYSLNAKPYDLIIVDTYFGDKYIDLVTTDLSRSHVVIFNRLFYKDKKAEALEFGKKLEKIFPNVERFYPPANLMFICTK